MKINGKPLSEFPKAMRELLEAEPDFSANLRHQGELDDEEIAKHAVDKARLTLGLPPAGE